MDFGFGFGLAGSVASPDTGFVAPFGTFTAGATAFCVVAGLVVTDPTPGCKLDLVVELSTPGWVVVRVVSSFGFTAGVVAEN